LLLCLSLLSGTPFSGQIETVQGPKQQYIWTSHGRVEGHLALSFSPAGAFSPDSSTLAVASQDKVVLVDLRAAQVAKVLRPRLEGISNLEIDSANFVTEEQVFLLASGEFRAQKGQSATTPRLGFRWDTRQDSLVGKLNSVGAGGGYGPPLYLPSVHYLVLNKNSRFEVWNPLTGTGGTIVIPPLTRSARLSTFSPDGHWLVLAQIEASSSPDPVVVKRSEHQFVDVLRGHGATVLSIAFSSDSRRVETACEDGQVSVYTVSDWKLLYTLSGHHGPVHWAEFSSDGQWIVSAGEDKTAKIWSAESGELAQSLAESQAPLLTAAFSANGEFVAATSEKLVLIWERTSSSR
jgi:WD40 repeat protein